MCTSLRVDAAYLLLEQHVNAAYRLLEVDTFITSGGTNAVTLIVPASPLQVPAPGPAALLGPTDANSGGDDGGDRARPETSKDASDDGRSSCTLPDPADARTRSTYAQQQSKLTSMGSGDVRKVNLFRWMPSQSHPQPNMSQSGNFYMAIYLHVPS